MTADEKRHLSRVAALGCIVCLLHEGVSSPAEVHHIKHHTGIGRRSTHYETLPLCPAHHRTGGLGVAYHAGPGTWELKYGTQLELLAEVEALLEAADA